MQLPVKALASHRLTDQIVIPGGPEGLLERAFPRNESQRRVTEMIGILTFVSMVRLLSISGGDCCCDRDRIVTARGGRSWRGRRAG